VESRVGFGYLDREQLGGHGEALEGTVEGATSIRKKVYRGSGGAGDRMVSQSNKQRS